MLLRFIRNPFVSLLALNNLLLYVHWSGNAYMLTFPSGLGMPLFLPSGLFTGAFITANLLLVYWSYAHFLERRAVSELALPGLGRELGIGLLLGFGLFTICVLIAMALGLYRIEGIDRWQNLLAGVTGGTFTTPFGEELLFRGVWFRILEGVFGGWVALVVSSLWFGFVHAGNTGETFAGVASIAIVYGPLLAVPFMVSRRLWIGIGLHGAWNYTMGKVFSGAISGNSASPGLFKTTFQGPELLTGGSAGMEGSLIAMLVSLAFTAVMLILAVRRGMIVPPSWSRKITRPQLDV
ncbi:CPBP family intramembrane glutamic endopeptidase [Cyanobium sp. Morenito 9A2]|uniref:CPBP family intramembrane glutamic endopeptidase n=1 Tax=Cyanobium sp. Morenito 9A2 TaxID=2823718 RepID=UPI0020CB8ED6|nr:CPBP family intramembrane glutamic endopeptidase [Cyanobium sp. Morenito 9A2]MCP9850207.1 CPBP family intramembrane metalloprotease [Cyanobium sp. Morenito 9A2]